MVKGHDIISLVQENKHIYILKTLSFRVGGGQDKLAWTAYPPGVKIIRVGGKISREILPPGGQAVQGGKINCYTGSYNMKFHMGLLIYAKQLHNPLMQQQSFCDLALAVLLKYFYFFLVFKNFNNDIDFRVSHDEFNTPIRYQLYLRFCFCVRFYVLQFCYKFSESWCSFLKFKGCLISTLYTCDCN